MTMDKPLQDWEYPEPDPDDDADELATITCPVCRREIYEDAPMCPYCGADVDELLPSVFKGRPIWFILLAMAGVIAFILAFGLGV